MDFDARTTGLQLRSLVTVDGLRLSLEPMSLRAPRAHEVVIRIEATPINPSDIGLLLGAADMATAQTSGAGANAALTAAIPPAAMNGMAPRLGKSMSVGNEGAGTVIAAGASVAAEALLGKVVAAFGGAMYAQYRIIDAADCLVLPEGTTPAEGASCFVNPLTALGMVETMRHEGHTALVHTAAASNLGRMLNRICLADGIGLVNVVRDASQEAILRAQGAAYVCNSSAPGFRASLDAALTATGATIAFDAIGGGKLAGRILAAMEQVANQAGPAFSRYGSSVHKQAYIYGRLDPGPTELNRDFGMAWGVGGWLLMPFLERIGADRAQALRARVAAEIKTVFASHYTREITLWDMLRVDVVNAFNARATGEKFLLNPARTA